MAQLRENLGHFVLCQEDFPRALVSRAWPGRPQAQGHLAWRWTPGRGLGEGLVRALSRAGSTLSPGPQLSQREFNDSVPFLS